MNPFDEDTGLTAAGELRWRGVVRERWSNGQGPGINGGLIAAQATRAATLATGLPPRSVTVHYLAPPAPGALDVAATINRQGRATAFLRLDFAQEDALVAQAVVVCTTWRDDAPAYADAAPPPVRGRDEAPRAERGGKTPPLLANYQLHYDFEPERRPSWVAGWIRTIEPRPCDAIALAAYTDAFLPPTFFRVPEPIVVPTLELTIHFLAEPPAGEHPWILGRFETRTGAGGVFGEDGELWSEDGTLLVQSRQIGILRRP